MALKRIGALWNKKDKSGKDFMSGTLDLGALGEAKIMIFKNEKKEENHPDWAAQLLVESEEEK